MIEALKEIGANHDKSPAQIALNWLLRTPNLIPIPGAKTADQARANAEAAGFEITAEEADTIDKLSSSFKVIKP